MPDRALSISFPSSKLFGFPKILPLNVTMVSAPMTHLDLYFFATALALFLAKFIERLDGGKLIDISSIKLLGRVSKFIPI